MKSDPTFLGVVRRVIGAKLLIELSPEILSENPIVNGRLYKLGQIGSFVRIPLGFLSPAPSTHTSTRGKSTAPTVNGDCPRSRHNKKCSQ
jgi:hypothetical protein